MQREYPKKLRVLFNSFPYILPTQFESFYSIFKLICDRLAASDVTPELLQQISKVYNEVKQMVDALMDGFRRRNESLEEDNNKVSQNRIVIFKKLQNLLDPFLSYLPQIPIFKAIHRHFQNQNIYTCIEQHRKKAEFIANEIISNGSMGESSNKFQSILGSKTQHSKIQLSQLVGVKGTSSKLYINGGNEMSVIFWVTYFKSDYIAHFDIFWQHLQHFMLNLLGNEESIYSNIFGNPNNHAIKCKVHSQIDPNNKYYITSANCNDFFVNLSEFQVLDNLIELSLRKYQKPVIMKSERFLVLKYGWKEGVTGTVSVNSFTHQQQFTLQKTPSTNNSQPNITLQLPQSIAFYITGSSIALSTRIFNSKFMPTIRFGSLADNEVSIKNRYVSRRQFTIIEEMKQIKDQRYDRVFEESENYFKNFKKQTKPTILSTYFLICLSPTNHTSLMYPHKVQVQPGLIFKFRGIFIQILKTSEVYAGLVSKNDILNCSPINNDSTLKINLIESRFSQNNQSQGDFKMLTGVPICKTEENQIEQQQDKTLLQLPKNKSELILQNCLECLILSGHHKNTKIIISTQSPLINISQSLQKSQNLTEETFHFDIQNGKFFLPEKTQILAKKANQVLQGHFSDKVELKEGMTICLEGIFFEVIE